MNRSALGLACAVVATFGVRTTLAQPWSFTRIADTSTIVPGSSVPFSVFELPSIDGGIVAFPGYAGTTSGPAGVYTGSGGALTTIADRSTAVPGGVGNFTGFGLGTSTWPSMHAGAVAFHGSEQGSLVPTGLYLREGGQLLNVADFQTPVPGGSGGNFFPFGRPSLENGRVVFQAAEFPAGGQNGIYSWQSGALSIIADKSTLIPGGAGTFTNFFDCSLDQGRLAFSAEGASNQHGLYLADTGGALTRLYDSNTVVPGGNGGGFTFLSRVSLSGESVAFWALGGGQEGFYTDVGGSLDFIVHSGTLAPGTPGAVFTGFGDIALDNGVVAFQASLSNGLIGVFSTHTGSVQRIIGSGDPLDGRTVEFAFFGGQGLDGDSIATYVYFTDGSRGIYMATIPAPGGAALVALGMIASARRRRSAA
ncbi:MAG: hypothetical protein ACKVU4_00565 [Phycisphaerales bacterium]